MTLSGSRSSEVEHRTEDPHVAGSKPAGSTTKWMKNNNFLSFRYLRRNSGMYGCVGELANPPDCLSGDRGFKPHRSRKEKIGIQTGSIRQCEGDRTSLKSAETFPNKNIYGAVAQLGAQMLCKHKAEGSSPFSSIIPT